MERKGKGGEGREGRGGEGGKGRGEGGKGIGEGGKGRGEGGKGEFREEELGGVERGEGGEYLKWENKRERRMEREKEGGRGMGGNCGQVHASICIQQLQISVLPLLCS